MSVGSRAVFPGGLRGRGHLTARPLRVRVRVHERERPGSPPLLCMPSPPNRGLWGDDRPLPRWQSTERVLPRQPLPRLALLPRWPPPHDCAPGALTGHVPK